MQLKTWKLASLGALILILSLVGLGGRAAVAQPAVAYVSELASLDWSQFGEFSAPSFPASAAAQESWERIYPFVVGQINDERIVSLSRYSIAATKKFHFVPGAPGAIKVLAANEAFVIYEATLADLPAAPAVVRELKVYIVSPNFDDALYANKIVITIRGERRE